jgi:predicted nucleic acid-binding protein
MRWVVDASIAAKWVAPEADSRRAITFLGDDLLAPDLIYPEFANILWKKHSRREMDANAVESAVRWLLHVPIEVHSGSELLPAATELSLRLGHPAYDCFYLALARATDCTLVTADRRLVQLCDGARRSDLHGAAVYLADVGR